MDNACLAAIAAATISGKLQKTKSPAKTAKRGCIKIDSICGPALSKCMAPTRDPPAGVRYWSPKVASLLHCIPESWLLGEERKDMASCRVYPGHAKQGRQMAPQIAA